MIAAKESTVYALETEQRKLSLLLPLLRFRKSGFFYFSGGGFRGKCFKVNDFDHSLSERERQKTEI